MTRMNRLGDTPVTKVLVVDDHPVFRQGLKRVLEAEADIMVCAEADDVGAALAALEALPAPDVAIVDLCLKGRSGLELIRDIKHVRPRLPVLMLSMFDESLYAERAMRAGASGYLTKQEAPSEVIDAIRRVRQGHVHLSPEMASRMVRRAVHAPSDDPETASHSDGAVSSATSTDAGGGGVEQLSDRELEVFELIGQGLSNRRIAERLYRSIKTIESHRENIKAKLGLSSSGQLLRRAVEHALQIEPSMAPDGQPPAPTD